MSEIAHYPDPDRILELLGGPSDRPVVMVNLLRFRERAAEPDGGLPGRAQRRACA